MAIQESAIIELSSMHQLAEARYEEDDWTGTTTKAERRKRQNRLNQRALRRRKAAAVAPYPAVSHGNTGVYTHNRPLAPRTQLLPKMGPTEIISCPEPVGYHYISSSSSYSRSTSPEDTVAVPLGSSYPYSAPVSGSPTRVIISRPLQILNSTTRIAGDLKIDKKDAELIFDMVQRRIRRAFDRNMFAISRDHLLSIIHYNVYRAFMENMRALRADPHCMCDETSVAVTKSVEDVPCHLLPTVTQTTVPHPAWIDILPHPVLRDNLIRNFGNFNEAELSDDLVGEIFTHPDLVDDPQADNLPHSAQAWLNEKQRSLLDDSPVTSHRRGLIVWSYPWNFDSWEVTPGYLRKWGWTLVGCDDLLRASNRWREERGDDKLCIEIE